MPWPKALPYWTADADQIAGAAHRPRRGLERDEAVGVVRRVAERRERATELVRRAGLLPHRPDDVDHLPVRDPLAAGPFALLALGAGDGALHAVRDAGRRADRDVRLHAALPQREAAVGVRRVDRAPHAILVAAHVAVGHRDVVDVRVHERGIPGHRVGDAVDVVPAAGVEADEVRRRARRGSPSAGSVASTCSTST